ncbi:MAG TPA: hypothetical protein VFW83_06740, partial [Bryobacteraceae bacterium]|nr:hypothetical protein [Bryobacteraceae bacterium]
IGDKLERAAIANDLASYLGVEPGLVLEQFKKSATDRRAQEDRPQAQIPAIERILLTALLSGDRARSEVLPRLHPELIEGFATREIFEAMRQTAELEGPAAFSALEARLGPAPQALLHEILAADDINDEALGRDQAEACLRRLESALKKRQMDDLRLRVKSAEREGRMSEALEWMTELHRLEREIREGAPVALAKTVKPV